MCAHLTLLALQCTVGMQVMRPSISHVTFYGALNHLLQWLSGHLLECIRTFDPLFFSAFEPHHRPLAVN